MRIKQNILWGFIILIVIIFLCSGIILPMLNYKKVKEQQMRVEEFQAKLKVGDNIVTATGIYARIAKINKNVVSLEISKGVLTNMDKSIIVGITKDIMMS